MLVSILQEIIVWIFRNCFFRILIGNFLIPPWVWFLPGNSIFDFLEILFWNSKKFFQKIFLAGPFGIFLMPPYPLVWSRNFDFQFLEKRFKNPGRILLRTHGRPHQSDFDGFCGLILWSACWKQKTPKCGYKRAYWLDYIVPQINPIYKYKHK